jgi:hypothetical protein
VAALERKTVSSAAPQTSLAILAAVAILSVIIAQLWLNASDLLELEPT